MSELHRLSEDSSLPAFDRAALRSAALDRPSPEARLAARAALGIGAGTALASTAPGATATAATKLASWATLAKLTALALVLGGAAVVTLLVLGSRSHDAPRPAPHASPIPEGRVATSPAQLTSTPEEKVVAVASLPEAPSDPSARAHNVHAPPGSLPRAPSSTRLGDEIARLETARAKLSAGDTAGTHAELDAYRREFEAGTLAPEAAALRVDAFVAAGDRARAIAEAHRYLADHPTGAAASRMRGIVSTEVAPFRDQNAESTP